MRRTSTDKLQIHQQNNYLCKNSNKEILYYPYVARKKQNKKNMIIKIKQNETYIYVK